VEAALSTRYALDDLDHNGLSDSWETQYFGHLGVDPDADPDNDGLTNRRNSPPARIRCTPIPTATACPTTGKFNNTSIRWMPRTLRSTRMATA